MTAKIAWFEEKGTGYLYSDVRLSKPLICKHHGSYVKRDFYCERGRHVCTHPPEGQYEVYEIE